MREAAARPQPHYRFVSGDGNRITHAPSALNACPLPQHSIPSEATKRRVRSTTGHLSEGTLKTMLEMQEAAQDVGGIRAAAKE
jgi:hypothetical protein